MVVVFLLLAEWELFAEDLSAFFIVDDEGDRPFSFDFVEPEENEERQVDPSVGKRRLDQFLTFFLDLVQQFDSGDEGVIPEGQILHPDSASCDQKKGQKDCMKSIKNLFNANE